MIKTSEYQDQIYYALGNLAAKEGNNAKAIEYYKKSVQANVSNEQQKTRSLPYPGQSLLFPS